MQNRPKCISIKGLTKAFEQDGHIVPVLSDFHLSLVEGEIVSIVGPSGCGKTTLLRLLNGVIGPDAGTISFHNGLRQRDIVSVMQKDLLLPWRRVRGNLSLGVEARGEHVSTELLDEWLETMDLRPFLDFYPNQLSGGLRKKVSLLRTLLVQPRLLLLDEPFGNIDYDQKLELEAAVTRWLTRTNHTAVWVTHDIDEAIAVSDRVLVLGTRPATIKATVMGLRSSGDPIVARQNPLIAERFQEIWAQLRKDVA